LEKIAKECGITKKRLNTELLIREKVIEFMLSQGIRGTKDVLDFFQLYHSDQKEVLSMIKGFNVNI